ncbi:unnamed protein product [Calypogeia fissa]
MGEFSSFLHSQLLITPLKPTKDFTGETIIVTGSNTGLGFGAVRHLSRLNAGLIIMAIWNLSKGAAAKTAILESTGRPRNSIEVWEVDLQSFDSVKAFVAKANQLQRIDAVIESAGIMTSYFKLVEGYESTIATNVIGTFLLGLLILPKLKESASRFDIRPHLSIVSSDRHSAASFPERDSEDIFGALNDETHAQLGDERYASPKIALFLFSGEELVAILLTNNYYAGRYAVSKLLELLIMRELGSLLSKGGSRSPGVIVNCMTPGLCKSGFMREVNGFSKVVTLILLSLFARSAKAGGKILVTAIEVGEESNGCYLRDSYIQE